MWMPFNNGVVETILSWYGVIGLVTAPLWIIYYLWRLNRSSNPWRFADMLMTKNRDGIEKADISKFGSMIALLTSSAVIIYMAVNRYGADNFVTIFITFISVFSGVQVANGALRVWDDGQRTVIFTDSKDIKPHPPS